MRKFVAERADTIEGGAIIRRAAHLIKHGKLVDISIVEGECTCSVAIISGTAQRPLARPNRVGHHTIGLCFAHTGIHHNHHIAFTVAVVVVILPIDAVGFSQLAGFAHHFAHALIVAIAVVAAIGGSGGGEGVDAIEVELWREFARRLVDEILLHTFIAIGVGVLKTFHRVAHLLVGVLHQDDRDFRATCAWHLRRLADSRLFFSLGTRTGFQRKRIGLRCYPIHFVGTAISGRMSFHIGDAHSAGAIIEIAIVAQCHRHAVGGYKTMVKLVAHHLHFNCGAIALGMRDGPTRLGRNRHYDAKGQNRGTQRTYIFFHYRLNSCFLVFVLILQRYEFICEIVANVRKN